MKDEFDKRQEEYRVIIKNYKALRTPEELAGAAIAWHNTRFQNDLPEQREQKRAQINDDWNGAGVGKQNLIVQYQQFMRGMINAPYKAREARATARDMEIGKSN
jgi:hypothetical protein